jgi:Glu-tRNA(Gln) amidotransferase subunit E-like FAD-binding protein
MKGASVLDEEKEVSLNEKNIVIAIPEDTVEVTVTARVLLEGRLVTVEKKMTPSEIREAFNDADENYLDPDATFQLKQYPEADIWI